MNKRVIVIKLLVEWETPLIWVVISKHHNVTWSCLINSVLWPKLTDCVTNASLSNYRIHTANKRLDWNWQHHESFIAHHPLASFEKSSGQIWKVLFTAPITKMRYEFNLHGSEFWNSLQNKFLISHFGRLGCHVYSWLNNIDKSYVFLTVSNIGWHFCKAEHYNLKSVKCLRPSHKSASSISD